MSKKAIIIGATSGIGRELAKILDAHGYSLGISGRRTELLLTLSEELQNQSYSIEMDISKPQEARAQFLELVKLLGGVDLVIISSGTGFINKELKWEPENDTAMVNVMGFTALANAAMEQFILQKSGHLVGISSIAAIRGEGEAPAYGASKAYVQNYLEALSKKVHKERLPITITDIQPGLVDTDMAKGKGLLWVAPVEKAAQMIFRGIEKRKRHLIVTKRWRLIAWLLKVLPFKIYRNL